MGTGLTACRTGGLGGGLNPSAQHQSQCMALLVSLHGKGCSGWWLEPGHSSCPCAPHGQRGAPGMAPI